jgi:hypothetical protein
LNNEEIWKIQKKSKVNSEKIGKYGRKVGGGGGVGKLL